MLKLNRLTFAPALILLLTAAALPAAAAGPSISVAPTGSGITAAYVVSGQGFQPGQYVSVYIQDVSDRPAPPPIAFPQNGMRLKPFQVAADGTFTVSLPLPSVSGTKLDVTAAYGFPTPTPTAVAGPVPVTAP